MFDKCPSITKPNNSFLLETIYESHHKIEFITKPDLDIDFKIIKDKNDKCLFITNCLFIKCPICLLF